MSLLDDDSAESHAFVHAAFWDAWEDLAACEGRPLELPHAATVAGALGVMARVSPDKLDLATMVADQREAEARAIAATCKRFAPLVTTKIPRLAPVLEPFAAAGPAIEAALDGDDAEFPAPELIEKLPAAVFRVPAIRTYLVGYFDRMLPGLEDSYSMAAAFWLCLRFRRWHRLTAFHRRTLRDYLRQPHPKALGAKMRAAWQKLEVSGRPAPATARVSGKK